MILLFFLLYLFALLFYWVAQSGSYEILLIGGMFSGPLFLGLAVYEARQERYYLNPIVIYLVMSCLYVSMSSLWAYAAIRTDHLLCLRMGVFMLYPIFPRALALLFFGAFSFYLGYKLVPRFKPLRRLVLLLRLERDYQVDFKHWLVFIGLGWALYIAGRMRLPVKMVGNIYNELLLSIEFAALIILISRNRLIQKRLVILPAGSRLYLAVFALVCFFYFYAVKSKMRHPMLLAVALFFWGYFLQRETLARSRYSLQRIRAWALPATLIVVSGLLVVLVVMPFGKKIAAGKGYLPTWGMVVENLHQIQNDFPLNGLWEFPARLAGGSLMGSSACYRLRNEHISEARPVHRNVMIGVIPRMLWKDKPFVSQGANFSIVMNLGGGFNEDTATTATAMTAIGELYWSYGVIGVIAGMIILGMMFSLTYEVFSFHFPTNPFRLWVVAILMTTIFLWFENDVTSNIVMILFLWVVHYPMTAINYSFIFRKKAALV